jgi:multidrug efflux pump subunit AcrA (membrane-fusion protein)
MIKRFVVLVLLSGSIIGAGFGLARGLRAFVDGMADAGEAQVPTTLIRRSDVEITVTTRGELQGGGSVPLMVPRAGGQLPITYLRDTGELVKAGDVVAEFDASAQQYTLREAEADLQEAQQQLLKAEADAVVAMEAARLQVVTTRADLEIADLEQRDNDFLGTVERRQNEIALARARNRFEQAVEALAHREKSDDAAIASRKAAVAEAEEKAETARKAMAGMVLRSPASGYVELAVNTNGLNVIFSGMQLPTFQSGDTAYPGQTVATIPDMSGWEVNTQIPETDRAFLTLDQPALVRPKAMPVHEFRGRVSLLGGSAGSAWNRTFNCRIALLDKDDRLRPGMSVDVVISVETLKDALWVPSQAVFEREGRHFVYRQTPEGFITHDVSLLRRTESQAVISGIDEGTTIALAAPGPRAAPPAPASGPLGALPQ